MNQITVVIPCIVLPKEIVNESPSSAASGVSYRRRRRLAFSDRACRRGLGHRNWINLRNTPLFFMGSTAAVVIFTLLAIVELVADQVPSTPSRTKPPGLIARTVLGGLSGAGVAVAGSQSIVLGAVLGMTGGIAGAFAGYQVRTRLVKALKVPDFVIAFLEDAVTIAGGLLIVSRF